MKKHRRALSLVLALVMVLALLPQASALDATVAQRKAALESTYRIRITFSSSIEESSYDYFLTCAEENVQYIPTKLWNGVANWLAARGRTLTIRFEKEDKGGYNALYTNSNTTITQGPFGWGPDMFTHEYGHLVHEILKAQYGAGTLQQIWTSYNNGVAYGSGSGFYHGYYENENPVFVDDYASSKYGEDFAETFMSILYISEGDIANARWMAYYYPNSPMIKKMAYLRQLLCDTFSMSTTDFPDANPPAPSSWAKDGVEEYQNLFDPDRRSFGVTTAKGELFVLPYQYGATRLRFAYSMSHELVPKLKGQYLTEDEYNEKWDYRKLDKIVSDMRWNKEFPFEDLADMGTERCLWVYPLYLNGVVGGTGAATFSPDKTLTRQEAATMLYRLCNALNYELPQGELTFADAEDIAPWAQEAVAAMSASGIMGGVGDNRFAPTDVYTYEQCAVTLLRVYKLLTAAREQ